MAKPTVKDLPEAKGKRRPAYILVPRTNQTGDET
jgi:hypothetical protein